MRRVPELSLAAIVLAAAMTAQAPSARAQKPTEQLAQECRRLPTTTRGVSDLAFCLGYLNGFNDYNTMLAALGRRRAFCPPRTGIHDERLRRVFLAWVDAHPADRKKSARAGVLAAFRDAFPCPRRRVDARHPAGDRSGR